MQLDKCIYNTQYVPSSDTKVISLISFRPGASFHLWPSHVAISETAIHKEKTIKPDVKLTTCAMGGFFWVVVYLSPLKK